MKHPLTMLVGLWATNGVLTISATWHDIAANAISLVNTAIITIGSTAILLYQRKAVADREIVKAKVESDAAALARDLASRHETAMAESAYTKDLITELKDRVEHVVPQRDKLLAEVRSLHAQLERTRCVFPRPDGAARCAAGDPIPPTTRDLE